MVEVILMAKHPHNCVLKAKRQHNTHKKIRLEIRSLMFLLFSKCPLTSNQIIIQRENKLEINHIKLSRDDNFATTP